MAGKGDDYRPVDQHRFNENFDKALRKCLFCSDKSTCDGQEICGLWQSNGEMIFIKNGHLANWEQCPKEGQEEK